LLMRLKDAVLRHRLNPDLYTLLTASQYIHNVSLIITEKAIEAAFDRFTNERKDIAILLINQHIADRIRHRVDTYTAAFPSLLEIPSKDHPYDPEKDSVLKRVRRLFGE